MIIRRTYLVILAVFLCACTEETIISETIQTRQNDWSLISVNFPKSDFIWDLTVSLDGAIWLAASNGVWRLDGQSWKVFTTQDGLPTNASFMGMWISYSYSDVLGVAPSTDEDAVHKQNGLVGMTVASDGAVWVGTGKGIARLNNFIWTHYKLPSSSEGAHLFPLVAGSDGTVWFYASGQLLRFDGNNWWHYSLPSEFEFSFWWLAAVGPDQSLWLGSQKMIVRYLPGGTPIKTEISIPATPVSP